MTRGHVRCFVLAGLAVVVLLVVLGLDFAAPPAEDAAMLLHYSQHLADGHGVVFNIGQQPVDGATDFLFMVMVAALTWLGMGVELSARFLNLSAFLGILVLIVWSTVRIHQQSIVLAALTTAYVAVGSAGRYIEWGFGTTVFALGVASTWVCADLCRHQPSNRGRAALLGTTGLLTALIRPEGAIIVVLVLVTLLLQHRSEAWRGVLIAGGIFGAGGLTYLAWRWSYFGYPLPNPYYKKGGGKLHPGGLLESIRYARLFLWPLAPLYLLALRTNEGRRIALFSGLPIVGFICSWVLLSPEMNIAGRFQYPALIIAALSVSCLVPTIRSGWPLGNSLRRVMATGVTAALLVLGFSSHIRFSRPYGYIGGNEQLAVARALAPYADRKLTLVTTEAGRIPLYSHWNTVDAWGLNDQWIAHHGGITKARLAALDPDLIFLHANFSPRLPNPNISAWDLMTATLVTYAEEQHMQLLFAWGPSPHDTWMLYVGPRIPEDLVHSLRTLTLVGIDYARTESEAK